ncbi:putative phage protein F-like protein [Clostridiales bacterium oral taxon 876 str. F0540]|nr:putative phage protein F-like protein [Clostridiales bacterium oral taxon 876 str. F0540]
MDKQYEEMNLQFTEKGLNKADESTKEAYKFQVKHRDELLFKIANVLLIYTILDSSLSLSNTEKLKLRADFATIISNIAVDEYNQEKSIISDILEEVTNDKYYSDAYTLSIGMDFSLKKLTDKQIKDIVDTSIDGELWSDRLWNNKKELESTLKLEVEKFLQGKTNVNQINKVIKDRFSQNAYNTRRLVQTEAARCQNSSNELFAEEHGIEKQMFCATLDNKTSEICRGYDGQVFDINDNNKPVPPLHPFCRSCLINVPFKEWQPIKRKDNSTKEIINYKDYNQWKQDKGIE